MKPVNFSVAVYCGSRPGTDQAHVAAATAVGHWIGTHGGQLVYGGGNTGLMGTVAKACAAAGGRVLGVMPQALVEREVANTDCDEWVVVQTMHERKAIMAQRADAFVAMAGGIGTFEELFEIWTWRQLGYHNKPVGLLNINGYYDGLNAFINTARQAEFMDDRQLALMEVGTQPAALLQTLVQQAGFNAALKTTAI
ncbi:TIGR00730 family Rossman fold protein [Comamonadaceae bacterium M7527]|nr:TIGR00730 family Rossman fold protein [Comamonadaceae bacterium M7527]